MIHPVIFFLLLSSAACAQSPALPFNRTNPVLYDNDDHRDMYTDEYLLSLASAGTIRLKAIITTYSADSVEYALFVAGRQQIIDKARRSGLRRLPDATAGPGKALVRPASNRIQDTKPLYSPGSRVIVAAALRASVAKPLVLVMGGQLTAIADAYLQNPAIADKIIVSGIFGVRDKTYNAGLDAWAWAIVLQKFRCLSFSDSDTDMRYNQAFVSARAQTPKARFAQELQQGRLPATALYQWLFEKHHPRHPARYMEQDGDIPAALPLVRPDYITKMERWRCTGIDSQGLPTVVPDAAGPLYLVTGASGAIATEEFWRAIENGSSRKHKNK